ncbi:hypothetical protein RFI_30515 [Reticulomyxa filosa]|uniref:Uncharacterized protein n=1 Tax=Reticulomyxa filosa TaxID=46433 RepID=X6LZY6_RETFI|nr:hypothetical protein RFI_30515 [Reticulomyxa filosa]|eukprot:ETO06876.1 hypothetical protein RFI_30515 [Reticulomyxa filosa]
MNLFYFAKMFAKSFSEILLPKKIFECIKKTTLLNKLFFSVIENLSMEQKTKPTYDDISKSHLINCQIIQSEKKDVLLLQKKKCYIENDRDYANKTNEAGTLIFFITKKALGEAKMIEEKAKRMKKEGGNS